MTLPVKQLRNIAERKEHLVKHIRHPAELTNHSSMGESWDQKMEFRPATPMLEQAKRTRKTPTGTTRAAHAKYPRCWSSWSSSKDQKAKSYMRSKPRSSGASSQGWPSDKHRPVRKRAAYDHPRPPCQQPRRQD